MPQINSILPCKFYVNRMLQFQEIQLSDIEYLRTEYFNSLPEFQELFIELMIDKSDKILILRNNKVAGYTIVSYDNVLIEFYLKKEEINTGNEIFNAVIKNMGIEKIYCKSFDSLLLNFCLTRSYPHKLIGVLYRDFIPVNLTPIDGIKMRLAFENDISLILKQENGIIELYETLDYLKHFINNQNFYLFYKDEIMIGCGTIIKTHKDWNYHDLGVWVHSNFRGQGIGSNIINLLKKHCIKNNGIPSCGCAIENIASQKMLGKSGFVSRYKMIEFFVDNDDL